jgi:sugar phosphate permease
MVLVGLGGPTVIPPVIAVLLAAVPAHRAGTASGLLNTSRQLGGALAVAVFGALLATPAGLAAGMRVSLLLGAAVAATAAFTAVAGLSTRH